MPEKGLLFEEIWNYSKNHMLVRYGFLVNLPDDFPKVDDNYNTLTSREFYSLFDKMIELPAVWPGCFEPSDHEAAKAFFTVIKSPYFIHVYIGVDNSMTFEVVEAEDILSKIIRSASGCTVADKIKAAISLIECGEDVFGYLHKNSTEWEDRAGN